jgi:methionyl-tRNA formyltransferase
MTFAPALTKEMQRLDFANPARQLHCLIRGLDPKPGAFTMYQEKVLKVFRPQMGSALPSLPPAGTVMQVSPLGAEIACGDSSLWLQELQLAGRKRLPALDFARGQKLNNLRLG